jgi:DNA-binding MarR family transcriptional regulator
MSQPGQLWSHSARTDILDSLQGGGMTFRELREDTGLTPSTIRRSIYTLRDRGYIVGEGDPTATNPEAATKLWSITDAGREALRVATSNPPRRQAPTATPTPPPVPDESSTSQGREEVPAEKPKRRHRRVDPLTLDEAAVALWLAADALRARRIMEQVRRYWNAGGAS